MSPDGKLPLVDVVDLEQWRRWLRDHHAHAVGAWLVYYKTHADRSGLVYGESVEEALCWGWVDNGVRRIDEDRFARRFVPRKPDSRWSDSNRRRVQTLLEQGLMQPAGLALVEAAKRSGRW